MSKKGHYPGGHTVFRNRAALATSTAQKTKQEALRLLRHYILCAANGDPPEFPPMSTSDTLKNRIRNKGGYKAWAFQHPLYDEMLKTAPPTQKNAQARKERKVVAASPKKPPKRRVSRTPQLAKDHLRQLRELAKKFQKNGKKKEAALIESKIRAVEAELAALTEKTT